MQVTSFVLKVIAIISMLIDHTSVALYPLIPTDMNYLYEIGRTIGRTAFPLFCFMIVEGFYHTRNKLRYLGSLFLLAIISELPFDAVFVSKELRVEYNSQNVFFTLALGLTAIIILDFAYKKLRLFVTVQKNIPLMVIGNLFNLFLQIFIIQPMYIPVIAVNADYGSFGFELILLIYYFEKIPMLFKNFDARFETDRMKFIFAGLAVAFWLVYFDTISGRITESPGLPAAVLIMLYNGQRGSYRIPKYVFYFFYPVHLTILYFMRKALAGY